MHACGRWGTRNGSRWIGRARPAAERWVRGQLVRGRGPWCRRCGQSTPGHRGRVEGCGGCQGSRVPTLAGGVCRLGRYQGPCGSLVRSLKYGGWWELATPLGRRLANTLRAECGGPAMRSAIVVPVPMPLSRRGRRRLDHADLLARAVARGLGARYARSLWRLWGQPQSGRSRSARLAASRRGWHLHPLARVRLRDARVVLVDDVLTTGQTARIASGLLRDAGVADVTLAVVAVRDVVGPGFVEKVDPSGPSTA